MAKVVFRPSGKTIECEIGDNLLEVARRADVYIEAPCNGSKSCGKCKVKLLTGEVNQEVSSHLSDEDRENGFILACCTTIISDIEVLTNSSLDMAMRGMKVEGGDKAKDKVLFDKAVEIAEKHNITLENNIKKTCITLDEPTLDDNISDVDRLERHISMNFGGKQMTYDIEVLKKMPKAFRKNNFEITITYRDFDDRLEIIDVEPGNTEGELYGLAIDIGTTSVVVCLVNLITNEVVEKGASGNGQLQFGADVINRIVYAIKKNNIEKAKAAVVDDTLNMLINELVKSSGVKRNNIVSVVASGNTTMSTLFLGIFPDYLRLEPFIPPFFKSPKLNAKEVGLDINPSASVYLSPNVASYVGGDITSGVLASGIWANEENVLFIDLGTNGEIVFGNQDFMMSCACSAGPAFEGGGISCGMRASAGAVDGVDIDPETLVPKLNTIDNEPAIGICGSGIIDLICEMLKKKVIDRRGKIHRDFQRCSAGTYSTSVQGKNVDAGAACQIGPLPVMAGEQQNLTILTLLEQPLQRSCQPLVIEGGEHVIQDQGDMLLRRQHQLTDGQPHRQIQLIGGALAQHLNAAGCGVTGGLGGESQRPVQQYLVVAPSRQGGENFRRTGAQRRGETVLQSLIGGGQGVHSQLDSLVFRLQGRQPSALLGQLGHQF